MPAFKTVLPLDGCRRWSFYRGYHPGPHTRPKEVAEEIATWAARLQSRALVVQSGTELQGFVESPKSLRDDPFSRLHHRLGIIHGVEGAFGSGFVGPGLVTAGMLIVLPTPETETGMPAAVVPWLAQRSNWRWEVPLAPLTTQLFWVEGPESAVIRVNGISGRLHLGSNPTQSVRTDLEELAQTINPADPSLFTLRGSELNYHIP